MKLQYMREFLDLAVSGNFTVTAARFFITQSTLSRHIQSLEQGIGCKLLLTSSHGLSLTEMGEQCVSSFSHILQEYDAIAAKASVLAGNPQGTLRLAYVPLHAEEYALAGFLDHFLSRYPGIDLQIGSYRPDVILTLLHENLIDIAELFWLEEQPLPDFTCHRIGHGHLTAALCDSHPAAGSSSLTLAELLSYPLVRLRNDPYTNRQIDSLLQSADFRFARTAEVHDISLSTAAIRKENAVLLAFQGYQFPPDILRIPVRLPQKPPAIGFLTPGNRHRPLADLFLEEALLWFASDC